MPHSTRGPSPGRTAAFKFPGDTKASSRTSMEKFPDLDTFDGQSLYDYNTAKSNGYPSNGAPSVERWNSRERGESWANGHPSSGKGHGRQKSLSDAFRTIRTRKGSVSANVHEISDALKAPVSPKLIVCGPLLHSNNNCLFHLVDLVYSLVFLECSDKYVFEIHPECVSQTCHAHSYTIRVRRNLLHILLLAIDNVSSASRSDPIIEAWHSISYTRSHHDDPPLGGIPDWRPSFVLDSDSQDSSLPRPHHQRAFSSFHGGRIPCYI